jgi:hypothetical protein
MKVSTSAVPAGIIGVALLWGTAAAEDRIGEDRAVKVGGRPVAAVHGM